VADGLVHRRPYLQSLNRPRLRSAAVAVAVLAISLLVYAIPPERSMLVCSFRRFTNLHCPGCGTFRAMHHLLHGRILEGFGHNALTLLVLPFLLYFFLSHALHAVAGCSLPRVRVPAIAIRALALAFVLFWVLRNLPLYPFTLLAP
jgi:hypothetical protein